MKKYSLFLFFLCILWVFSGCSSVSVKEVYGTWYVDADDVRNIIQLYKNDTTENAFIWAVYDIAADERTSVETGTYELNDGTITFAYMSGIKVTFDYERKADKLTLVMDGAAIEFQLYEISD